MKRRTKNAPATSRASRGLDSRLLISAWKETLAALAPGLAHDFNNALTGIMGISEALLMQIDSNHPFYEGLLLIKQQVQQTAQLTHRIARLYQDKPGTRDYQDLNSIAAEVVALVGKVIPKRIEVRAEWA